MITIQDIAKLAGVSKATVSLALSNHPRISRETKQRIRAIAEQRGYIPNRNAVGLSKSTSRSIGILFMFDEGLGDFFRDTIMGICQDALKVDYNVVLIGISAQQQLSIKDKVMRSGVEGVIVISFKVVLNGLSDLMKMNFPMVFIGKRYVEGMEEARMFSVASDHFGGGAKAAEHMLSKGHTNIVVATPEEIKPWDDEKIAGFLSVVRRNGVFAKEPIIRIASPYRDGDACWGELEQSGADGIYATMPNVGLAILQYFQNRAVTVPEDVTLTVFDNSSTTSLENLPLTIIKQDLKTMGKIALKMLLDLFDQSESTQSHILVSESLIERD